MPNSNKIKTDNVDFSSSNNWNASYFLRGDGSFQPISINTSIPIDRTVFVSKNGDNGTALPGRLDRPFLTIEAAITAALTLSPNTTSRVLIKVFSGYYLNDTLTGYNGLDFDLSGCSLEYTGVGKNFFQTGGNFTDSRIFGYPIVGITANPNYLVFINHDNCFISMKLDYAIVNTSLATPSTHNAIQLNKGYLSLFISNYITVQNCNLLKTTSPAGLGGRRYFYIECPLLIIAYNARLLEINSQAGTISIFKIQRIIHDPSIGTPPFIPVIVVGSSTFINDRIFFYDTIFEIEESLYLNNIDNSSLKISFINCEVNFSGGNASPIINYSMANHTGSSVLTIKNCRLINNSGSNQIITLNSTWSFNPSIILDNCTLQCAGTFAITSNALINIWCYGRGQSSKPFSNITQLINPMTIGAVI